MSGVPVFPSGATGADARAAGDRRRENAQRGRSANGRYTLNRTVPFPTEFAMLTAWCLALGFSAPWVVGAPVCWALLGCRILRPGDWLWVPFIGLAATIGPLQTLVVFVDLPLVQTAPWFWSATALLWGLMLASRSGRASLGTVPRRIILFALLAYLGQGVGVAARGVERYHGNLHSDQYHYILLAQFLMDEPFSLDWNQLGERPWLVMGLVFKGDRIGQSVLHGLLAATAGRDAIDLFFPTVLLGPSLMVPAVFLLGPQCGLSRRWTTWAALAAAAAPGVEFLVTCCFLSHALCLSPLVAFLAGVIRLARGGRVWRALPGTAAALVVGVAVYTEFAPLFAGVAAVALTAGLVYKYVTLKRAAAVSAALVLAGALNPAAVASAGAVFAHRAQHSEMRTHCRTSVWLALYWLHYEKATLTGGRVDHTVAHLFFYGATAAAAMGALVLAIRGVRADRRLAPALGSVALVGPPVALWVVRPGSEYVIAKLVLTLAPLAMVFLACGFRALARTRVPGPAAARTAAVLVFAVLVMQSGLEQRSRMRGGNDVGPAALWNDPRFREVCDALVAQPRADVVIAIGADGTEDLPSPVSGAICYFARHHRIRLAAPLRVWQFPLDRFPAPQLAQTGDLAPGTLLITRDNPRKFTSAAFVPVVTNSAYQLVRLTEPGTVRTDARLASAYRVP
jgi:hypothetical protein